jgi:hypothetical protein
MECVINSEGKSPVSWTRPLRNFKDKHDFEVLLKELEDRGIIEPSTSVWLNPVVLTRKKSGELRFCVDFRRLNELVDLDEFQIPKVSETIASLRNKRFFP